MRRCDLKLRGDVYVMESHPRGRYVKYLDAATIERQLDLAKTALGNIARSYPETEEGQALAETAREVLKEILK